MPHEMVVLIIQEQHFIKVRVQSATGVQFKIWQSLSLLMRRQSVGKHLRTL